MKVKIITATVGAIWQSSIQRLPIVFVLTNLFPFPLSLNCLGIRQPSLGGRGTALAVDEGNLYSQAKRDKVQALLLMKSCLRHSEIIKLTFYNEIFRFAEFVFCADEIPPAAPFGFDRLRMTRRVMASFYRRRIYLRFRYPSAFRGEPPLPYTNFILIKAKTGKPDRKISVSVSLPLGEGAEARGG